MTDIPAAERDARFVCVLALAQPNQPTVTVRGECAGEILTKPTGTGGFGYDPLFFIPDLGKTLAELSLDDKNIISHRARAIRALQKLVAQGERK
jgi:XTP/dITP diphosphohydrolase